METHERLRTLAMNELERLKAELVATGQVEPSLYMVKGDALEIFVFDPDWMNSPQMKTLLFGMVRNKAKEDQADAVIFAFDTWALEYTPEQLRRQKEDPEYREGLRSVQDVPTAAKLGYGELWDAITVTVQSPLSQILVSQHYRCKSGETGGRAFSHWGEFNEITTGTGKLVGRMVFFDAPQGAAI